jgi:hypothetical protein
MLELLCTLEMEMIIVFGSEIRDVTKDGLKQYIKFVSKANRQPTMLLYKHRGQRARSVAETSVKRSSDVWWSCSRLISDFSVSRCPSKFMYNVRVGKREYSEGLQAVIHTRFQNRSVIILQEFSSFE